MAFKVIHGDDVAAEVFRMRRKGMSMRMISNSVGIGLGSVHRILHKSRACDQDIDLNKDE